MDIGIDLLRSFVAVAETCNFTHAAKTVYKTQSAVSQQIKKLETDLGVQLFDRSGRTVTLTSVGESFLPHARRVLKAHDEAIATVTTPNITGLVRAGTTDELSMRYLPGILKHFSTHYPAMQVEVWTESGPNLMHKLKKGELDFYLNTSTMVHPGTEIVAYTPLLWVSSALHCAHREETVPLAVYSQSCSYRHHATEALSRAGRSYRIAYSSPALSGLHAALTAGTAVSVLVAASLPPDPLILGPEDGFPPLPIANVYIARAETLDSGAECFIRILREAIRQDNTMLPAMPSQNAPDTQPENLASLPPVAAPQ